MKALPTGPDSAFPAERDGYVLAAAVTDTFEPAKLEPVAGFDGDLGTLLDVSVMAEKPDGAVEWRLPNNLRRAALQVLASEQRLSGTLEANRVASDVDSPYQRIFEDLLVGKKIRLEEQSLEQLQASLNAVKLLEGIAPSLPDEEEIRAHLIYRDFVQQFEMLAGRNFVGREEQLTELRNFVDVLPQGRIAKVRRSAVEAFGRIGIHRFLREAPLMITGMGGMGKSALLSKFLLEHLHAAARRADFLIAYIDFDRPGIWPDQPLTVLAEIAQQLGLQVPQAAQSLRRLNEQIVREIALTGSYESEYQSSEAVNNVETHGQSLSSGSLREFGVIWRSVLNATTSKTLLLVLDTFEEVSQRSAVHQAALLQFIGELQAILPRLRVVISGRGMHADAESNTYALSGLVHELAKAVEPLELPELSRAEAAILLESNGSPNERLNVAIVERVGGHPLSLKLAAQLVRTVSDKLAKRVEDLTAADLFGPVWVSHMYEGMLYRRIIAHIPDEPLQKLADPGLVLRELTAEIIFHVLNEPCGLGLSALADAERLFERLKEFNQLVSIQSTHVVRHRSELRERVLSEMIRGKLPLCRDIWFRAARYFEERGESRTEEVYCRLMLDEHVTVLAERWQPGLEKGLLKSRVEMPENARQFVDLMALRADTDPGSTVEGELGLLLLAEEMKLLLARGNAKEALELFKAKSRRKVPPFDSILYVVYLRAIAQSGGLEAALAMAWSALERVEKKQGTADSKYEELLLLCCQVTRSQRLTLLQGLKRAFGRALGNLSLDWARLFKKFNRLDFNSSRTTNILRIAVEMLDLYEVEFVNGVDQDLDSASRVCAEQGLAMLRQMSPHYFGVDGALLVRSFAQISRRFPSAPELQALLEVPQVMAVLQRDYPVAVRAFSDENWVAGADAWQGPMSSEMGAAFGPTVVRSRALDADSLSDFGTELRGAIRARDEGSMN